MPSLEPGDHLTRVEFERRYAAMPWLKKAELIDGVVYVPSPVSNDHSSPHFRLIGWLSKYAEATPGVEGRDNATLRFDDENEPQPDALLNPKRQRGEPGRCLAGASSSCGRLAHW
ncbi:MAG TPA: Uma2 family endonuclease [Pirellulales bacterium]|nr:Uma2 family endonuclease [Pirellulales bacterium]